MSRIGVGRATQMSAGGILWFIHVDRLIPANVLGVVGGGLQLRFD
jgi:hypothetical protein